MPCEVAALVQLPVPASRLRRTVSAVLRALQRNPRTAEVSVAVVGDRRMRELNARYRRRRGTTDVLSFPGSGSDLGEIVISLPRARRQSRQYGTTLAQELDLLLVHGVLHLIGFDHHTRSQRVRMERMERRLLDGSSLIRRAQS